jgi:Thiamine pyrophosphate enzyme, N-terminal TPP binding domain/Aldehyde dehydrogenase family
MKASDLFLESLAREGVEVIFGVPGEEIADLMISLLDSPIRFVITRHEQGAAFVAWNELEVGGVVINDVPSLRVDSMPYGGVKDSGFGREGVRYAMEDMTEIRLLVLNRGAPQPGIPSNGIET